VDFLAGDTNVGGGQATGMGRGWFMGGYAPAHYLKQFLPKYASLEEVERKAKAAGYDSWKSHFRFRMNWTLNTELPVLSPWKTVSPINTPTWGAGAEPVLLGGGLGGQPAPLHRPHRDDPGGEPRSPEPARHRREYDLQERHTALTKLPVFLENQKQGNYRVRSIRRRTDATRPCS